MRIRCGIQRQVTAVPDRKEGLYLFPSPFGVLGHVDLPAFQEPWPHCEADRNGQLTGRKTRWPNRGLCMEDAYFTIGHDEWKWSTAERLGGPFVEPFGLHFPIQNVAAVIATGVRVTENTKVSVFQDLDLRCRIR